MALERRIAVIDKNTGTIDFLEEQLPQHGVAVYSKLVSGHISAEEVAAFVTETDPQLLLLAESYTGTAEAFAALSERFQLKESAPGEQLPPLKRGEGIDALRKIRETRPHLPVYMISAFPHYETQARAAGANGYVGTYPQPQEVIGLLERHAAKPTQF